MEELKRINAKLARKQIVRIVGGVGTIALGSILIGKCIYQKGKCRHRGCFYWKGFLT